MSKDKINYSKNVVGCSIKGDIFIHPELYKHPDLYHAIVKHEKQHSKKWGLKDLSLDAFGNGLENVKPSFYKFILTHPRTLLGYFPITKVGKYWGFDLELTAAWILIFLFGWWIGGSLWN